jgi:23S rRNA (uracil1939-C5)-methyltransferase
LQEHLRHFGGLSSKTYLEPITGPTLGYRGRARLSVKYLVKKQKLLIGFHEKNGRFVADIDKCSILHPTVGEKIIALRTLISSLSIYQQIPQIEIAIADNMTALVIRHLQELTSEDKNKLITFANENSFAIYLQPGGLDSVYCLTNPKQTLSYRLTCANIELLFQPTDFTQINQAINQALVKRTIELMEPEPQDKILDLFCGLGNFTLALAKKCAQIIGVEGHKVMVERATQNAVHNAITNATFYCADLTKELPALPWANQHYYKILLDPPRTGALEICQQIKKFGAKKIIYVSCNPATLARDAKELVNQGYELAAAGIVDMFPHTSHVENLAVFTKS